MRDLALFVQFRKGEKYPWRSVTFMLKPATFRKVTLLHGCFSRFLNCTNGTKSRKASHITLLQFERFLVPNLDLMLKSKIVRNGSD